MEVNKRNSSRRGFVIFTVIVIFIVYISVQVSDFLSKDVKITGLRAYVTEDKVISEMLIYKDETVVISNKNGGCDYMINDGEKVAVGNRIAVIYENMDSPDVLNKIRDLELEIESLEDILQSANTFDYDITKLDDSLNSSISNILTYTENKNYDEANENMTELKKLINKRSLLNGNSIVTSDRINEIQAQIDNIVQNNFSTMTSVYSSSAGFFSSGYDGLEGEYPLTKSENITVDKFNKFMETENDSSAPSGYIGSVISGFSWTGSFKVNSEYSVNTGDFIKIRLPEINDSTMYVEVTNISDPKGGEKVVTVFSESNLEVLTENRKQVIEIIEKTYDGLRVANEAVKTVDNTTGVFVLKGQILDFTEIEILYSSDEYVIITAAEGYKLYPNDDVVISGKNLYDGKVVRTSS